tara:strand:+ start:390 stop:599 length:210 start_codon:yes stop_codon:yes gene_type:complete
MKLALVITLMCIVTGILMTYDEYLKTIKRNHLWDQLDLVDEEIEKCDNHFKMKKLIALRKKIKKKLNSP